MSLKRIVRISAALVAIVILSALFSVNAFAKGTADFNIPKGAVNKGSEVSVGLNFTADDNIGFVTGMISYDDSVLEFVSSDNASGGGGIITLNGFPDSPKQKMNVSLKFKALKGGTCRLDLNNCYITSDDGTQIGSPTAYANITVADNGGDNGDLPAVTESAQSSSDDEKIGDPEKGYLKSLTVSQGTLKPNFSYDIYDYYVDVDNDVDICEIDATTANVTDKIWYTGNEDLAVGKNVRTIKVTDTQGYYHIYTVTITRAEPSDEVNSEQQEVESTYQQNDSSSVVSDVESSAAPVVINNDKDDSTNKFSGLITGAMIIVLVTLLIAAAVIITWLRKKKNSGKFD